MVNQYQALVVDKAAVASALKAAKEIGEYKRLQAVYLREALGLKVEAIAAATGFSVGYVKHIHSAFRHAGMGAIVSKGKGGRYHAHMTVSQEEAFIAPFVEAAKAGHVLEVSRIHRALEGKMGRKLRVQNTYNLLHRHGWRKIAPRPKHPQGDPVAQEAFKKTGRRSSRQRRTKPRP
jgi:transposase